MILTPQNFLEKNRTLVGSIFFLLIHLANYYLELPWSRFCLAPTKKALVALPHIVPLIPLLVVYWFTLLSCYNISFYWLYFHPFSTILVRFARTMKLTREVFSKSSCIIFILKKSFKYALHKQTLINKA